MKVAQLLSDAIVVVKLLDSWEEETSPPIEQLIAPIVLNPGKVIGAMYNIDIR
jgi:hypothetical protein